MMPRQVSDETLDGLSENDPAAIHSRRDLQRIHRFMGTRAIVLKALRQLRLDCAASSPLRILELGAGDGTLMLAVAQALKGEWPAVELTLLDRQNLVSAATVDAYAQAGWNAASAIMDVMDWAQQSLEPQPTALRQPLINAGQTPARFDLIVAHLFLHHFEAAPLARLLGAVASRTDGFFACEPYRGRLALAGSHLVGAIGANAVTREDAVLSVHAGFRDSEISAFWPQTEGDWHVKEYAAGLFSHCFVAQRASLAQPG